MPGLLARKKHACRQGHACVRGRSKAMSTELHLRAFCAANPRIALSEQELATVRPDAPVKNDLVRVARYGHVLDAGFGRVSPWPWEACPCLPLVDESLGGVIGAEEHHRADPVTRNLHESKPRCGVHTPFDPSASSRRVQRTRQRAVRVFGAHYACTCGPCTAVPCDVRRDANRQELCRVCLVLYTVIMCHTAQGLGCTLYGATGGATATAVSSAR